MMSYYPVFDALWWLSEVYFCHLNSLSIALAFSDIYIETSKKDAMSLAWYMNHNIFEMNCHDSYRLVFNNLEN